MTIPKNRYWPFGEAVEWVWWKTGRSHTINPKYDSIHPRGGEPFPTGFEQYDASDALLNIGLTAEQVLSIFNRRKDVGRPWPLAPTWTSGDASTELEKRCFLVYDFETWVRFAQLINLPIHVFESHGSAPDVSCHGSELFMVTPDAMFKPSEGLNIDSAFLDKKSRLATLTQMIAWRTQLGEEDLYVPAPHAP